MCWPTTRRRWATTSKTPTPPPGNRTPSRCAARARAKLIMALLRQECEFVSNMETDFMGGAPYNKYVWHFNVNPGRGGRIKGSSI